MSRQDLEALFLANLPTIEKILGALTRRRGLSPDAAEEFAAWAKLRLIENDYAILAKFQGKSKLATYLTVVIAMLLREYHVQEWGRWRPSAAAQRAGPFAIRVETLVCRDGMALADVGNMLRTSGETTLSDKELAAMVATFPRRTMPRPAGSDAALAYIEGSEHADQAILEQETAAEQATTSSALNDALDTLSDEDRLIVRLHYMKDMSVADIARALNLPQKPLYPRLKTAIRDLRRALEKAGVDAELIREWAADPPP